MRLFAYSARSRSESSGVADRGMRDTGRSRGVTGWPADLSDDEILRRLVALNAERAEEERRGLVRWLRPEFQNPGGDTPAVQAELALPAAATGKGDAKSAERPAWPKALPEQARAVRAAMAARPAPATA